MVLVVDDFPDMCRALQRLLELEGYQTLCASSAREAEMVYTSSRPDVILLDYHMEDKNGLEVLRDIRGHHTLATVPVLMFSADDDETLVAEALQLGASDWFVKGQILWSDLLDKVQRLHRGYR